MGKFAGLSQASGLQIAELASALLLCSLIGIEREIQQKSAGLRTHTVVGVSAALFMLISKYGFMDIIAYGQIVLDPSRVAAQVVSGIGFISGGVIFMRRDVVRGLTTAASIWFTAALGMACGAGLIVLSIATTVGYFLIMLAFPILSRRLPKAEKLTAEIYISYEDGRGLLRTILIRCTELRFAIDRVRLDENRSLIATDEEMLDRADKAGIAHSISSCGSVTLTMLVKGKRPVSHLIATLSNIAGVHEVGKVSREPPE